MKIIVLLHSQGFTDTQIDNWEKLYQVVTYLKKCLSQS